MNDPGQVRLHVYNVVFDIDNPLHMLVVLVNTTYFGLHKRIIIVVTQDTSSLLFQNFVVGCGL